MDDPRWPALPYESWKDTCATLHRWTQVVGKLAIPTTPMLNHYWNLTLQLTARGLATPPMSCPGGRTLTASFDFVDHELELLCADGGREVIRLEAKSVARFHEEVTAALARLGIAVRIWTTPVEIAQDAIPFEKDTMHAAYVPAQAHAFFRALDAMRPVFEAFRARFVGKSSPVHFFWGSFDLALTRFSGRRAPPRTGADPVMREAYSHEVVSHGFWPGDARHPEAAFYAYAAPEPAGFREATVSPAAARYHGPLNEFILPYDAVRTAASPEEALASFLQSTYDRAADLAGWDRGALER